MGVHFINQRRKYLIEIEIEIGVEIENPSPTYAGRPRKHVILLIRPRSAGWGAADC